MSGSTELALIDPILSIVFGYSDMPGLDWCLKSGLFEDRPVHPRVGKLDKQAVFDFKWQYKPIYTRINQAIDPVYFDEKIKDLPEVSEAKIRQLYKRLVGKRKKNPKKDLWVCFDNCYKFTGKSKTEFKKLAKFGKIKINVVMQLYHDGCVYDNPDFLLQDYFDFDIVVFNGLNKREVIKHINIQENFGKINCLQYVNVYDVDYHNQFDNIVERISSINIMKDQNRFNNQISTETIDYCDKTQNFGHFTGSFQIEISNRLNAFCSEQYKLASYFIPNLKRVKIILEKNKYIFISSCYDFPVPSVEELILTEKPGTCIIGHICEFSKFFKIFPNLKIIKIDTQNHRFSFEDVPEILELWVSDPSVISDLDSEPERNVLLGKIGKFRIRF